MKASVLLCLLLPASALKLGVPKAFSGGVAVAASTLAAPFPALAASGLDLSALSDTYSYGLDLTPEALHAAKEHGDVVIGNSALSAALGLVFSLGFVSFVIGQALHFGADEACIVVEEKEHCGRVKADDDDMLCVLSASDGWGARKASRLAAMRGGERAWSAAARNRVRICMLMSRGCRLICCRATLPAGRVCVLHAENGLMQGNRSSTTVTVANVAARVQKRDLRSTGRAYGLRFGVGTQYRYNGPIILMSESES